MRDVGRPPPDLSTRVSAAVATAAPLVVALAFVIFLGVRGADVAAAPTSAIEPAPARETAPAEPTARNAVEASIAADYAPRVTSHRGRQKGSPIVWVRHGRTIGVLDGPGGDLVAKQSDETEFGSPTVFSVQRQRNGWIGVTTSLVPNGELGWIRADPRDLRVGYVDHSIVVDLSDRSATLSENGTRLRSWPVTVGAASSSTPTGTFAVTDTFRGSLDPAYGCCAVALSATQPNLPADWTGGDRIALHGTGGPLGVAASLGCIRSDDSDLLALLRTIPLGTPVTIRS